MWWLENDWYSSSIIIGSKTRGGRWWWIPGDDTQVCSCHVNRLHHIFDCSTAGSFKGLDPSAAFSLWLTSSKFGLLYFCFSLSYHALQMELKSAGHCVSNNLCRHFSMTIENCSLLLGTSNSRQISLCEDERYNCRLKKFPEVMHSAGIKPDSVACGLYKPVVSN